jgi:hypothetical protein
MPPKGSKKGKDIEKYISTFSPLEKKAYEIAKNHLESSFDIEKSIGYCDWIKEKEI